MQQRRLRLKNNAASVIVLLPRISCSLFLHPARTQKSHVEVQIPVRETSNRFDDEESQGILKFFTLPPQQPTL